MSVPSQKSPKQKILLNKVVRCISRVTKIHSESHWCHCSAGQGKAKRHSATCILSHFQVSSWSLILMLSQIATLEAKPGYVYSILKPHIHNSSSPVQPLLCEVKPSYIYSILKPHGQSSRSPVRLLLREAKPSYVYSILKAHGQSSKSLSVDNVALTRIFLHNWHNVDNTFLYQVVQIFLGFLLK